MAEDIQERRRRHRRQRWGARLGRCMMYAVIAEAFLIPLLPLAAHVALGIGCVAILLRLCIERDFHLCRMPYDAPALLFLVISFLSVFIAPDVSFSLYNFSHLVPIYVSTYLLVGQTVRTSREVQRVVIAMALSAALVILYGFYQFIFGIDISAMKWVDGAAFPELSKRVFSTWENPNILAGYLDIVACLALGLAVGLSGWRRGLALTILVLALACLGMTYARGACLVIGILLAGYGVLRDWRVLLGIVAIGAGVLFFDPVLSDRLLSVFTRIDTSSEMRLAFWESTVAMIMDHPFLGIGWGMYFMVYPEYDFYLQGAPVQIVHAHNMYLNYAAEIGIPGALAFFWFFFGSLLLAFRLPRKTPPWADVLAAHEHEWHAVADVREALMAWRSKKFVEGLALGIGLAMLSVALNGITDHLLFNIPSSMLLWMLAAMAAAVHTMAGEMKEG
ncbi:MULTISPECIES: O-antigen ligase [Selenomonas]|uniref:O-antigen ligase family protein n=1 Tax=Selenomonas TaxID=970 RepID=UPI0001E0901D|nr:MULTISPECIES: O-antigen ligase family protein [Selenomonas]AKT53416.1 polymerase [Selenomonas sp. oral taxon 478]EFM22386.1 O-antigen polymerase [Selenomonas sp. oral taxon 149 str. 67H29BP]